MDTETHPDPFQDAMNHGLYRAVQVASCAVTAAQVYVYQRRAQARVVAERDDRARRALGAQIRADRDAARAGWAPVLDPGWLRQADLSQVSLAWGAAMPYADRAVPWYEPAAATAMRKSEERLRVLHPHAMTRYDQLRGDGIGPADAMRDAAPLFASQPRANGAPHAPRLALEAPASPQADATGAQDAAATADAAAARASQAPRPWERDFPMPIRDVVATVGNAAQVAAPSSAAAPAPALQAGRRPGPQP
jgi:hypothetical protein